MSSAHIVYAALFRLAIIAAGFGCVVMGYRLFVLGVMPKEGSGIDSEFGQIRLSLKNAAPGTCFAVLGIVMIVAMIVQGNPEKKIVAVRTNGARVATTWRSDDVDSLITEDRGDKNETANRINDADKMYADSDTIITAIARGRELEAAGRLNEAIKAYAVPLTDGHMPLQAATEPLRAIAAVYLDQDRLSEGLAYALLAYQVEPGHAGGLALIARIQLGRKNYAKAVDFISQAARIDAAYIAERDRIKGQGP
jgi:hypothetical protein